MSVTLPALFVSHGPPTLPLEDLPARHFLAGLGDSLPRPTAILSVSAHWETDALMVTTRARQTTIHDFYGFPDTLYAMRYDAPGAPDLAEDVMARLQAAGFTASGDADRGLDHGAWTPLSLIYPAADIPVIQLSIQTAADPAHHLAVGAALAPLREAGVLIIASGNITHNLMEWRRLRMAGLDAVPEWVTDFQLWVAERVANGDRESLMDFQYAPQGRRNHPTDEHFLPFFVALGAGGESPGRRLHQSVCYTVLAMDAYAFG